jgi:hypothetical protein
MFYLVFFLLIELIIFFLFKKIKKDFQWILDGNNIIPEFKKIKFKDFLIKKFSPVLGWDYKRNRTYYDFNNKKKIPFYINKSGYRGKIIKNPNVAVYGDSYAICRQVVDEKTWENQVNIINKKIRIANYGVGNYGLDQAILKYRQSHLDRSIKTVIMCVVPETISRIQCQWKHVIEHGNINAFKPRFEINDNDKLIIKKNLININTNLVLLKNIIIKNLSNERFYNERLKRKVFKFPFSISFLKNFKFNFLIFNTYFFYKINPKKNAYFLQKKLFEILYKNNIYFNHKLYNDYKSVLLLEKIIYFFRDVSVKKKHDPILVIIPQKYDLISDNKIFYQEFFKKIKKIKVIDLTNYLLGKNNIYIEDKYGGHLNSYGNYLVAKYLNKKIFNNLSK